MKTIAIMIQRGGVAKTTTTTALGAGLNANGKRVLLIDLDPQQNLSFAENIDVFSPVPTLYDVFMGQPIEDAIQPTQTPNRYVITGGLKLASADLTFSGTVSREYLLKRNLDRLQDRFDYCLIDTPPGLGLLTMNAATAADHVIIPLGLDALSLQGLSHLWGFISDVQRYCNPDLDISGILLTQYDARTIVTQALEEQVQQIAEQHDTKVFNARIRRSQAIRTAQAMQTIDVYYSKAKAAIDYRAFTAEVLEMYEGKVR